MKRVFHIVLLLLTVLPLSAQIRSASNPSCDSNCEILRVRHYEKSMTFWINRGVKLVAPAGVRELIQ